MSSTSLLRLVLLICATCTYTSWAGLALRDVLLANTFSKRTIPSLPQGVLDPWRNGTVEIPPLLVMLSSAHKPAIQHRMCEGGLCNADTTVPFLMRSRVPTLKQGSHPNFEPSENTTLKRGSVSIGIHGPASQAVTLGGNEEFVPLMQQPLQAPSENGTDLHAAKPDNVTEVAYGANASDLDQFTPSSHATTGSPLSTSPDMREMAGTEVANGLSVPMSDSYISVRTAAVGTPRHNENAVHLNTIAEQIIGIKPALSARTVVTVSVMSLLLSLILAGLGLAQVKGTFQAPCSKVCKWVESVPSWTKDDVEAAFQPRGGYDCLLLQPQSSDLTVRVTGRICAVPGTLLCAPVTRRSCVYFSASASEQRLDGITAPPAAFHCMSAESFKIELRGGLALRVRGQDVAPFDMVKGRHIERFVLNRAPDHFQDFIRTYGNGNPATRKPSDAVLEFQECILEAGAEVTCVGELRRSENGELGLWPLQQGGTWPSGGSRGRLSGLTSWEHAATSEVHVEKVMVSDDPRLR